MTFEQANTALAELAGEKYRTIKFELETMPDGRTKPRCGVYIDGFGFSENFVTYELALGNMAERMKQAGKPAEITEMFPK